MNPSTNSTSASLEGWKHWLIGKKEKRKASRIVRHSAWAEKPSASVEEGPSMLHNINKPLPWKGGAQVIEDFFDVAQPLKKGLK